MSIVSRWTVPMLVTATGGAAQSFYTPLLNGQVQAIRYTRGGSSGISTNAHFTITAEQGGFTILSVTATDTNTWYPRAYAQDSSGGQLGFTSAATPPPIPVNYNVGFERIKIQVTSGGTASNGGTSGTLNIYISGV